MLAICACVALVTRLPMVGFDFVNVDEAAHMVGALELIGEGTLYRTFADNKPPLIYLYALSGGSLLALRLLGIALLWLPLAWLAASEAVTKREQALLGCLYLLSSAGFVAADTHAVNTEVLGLLPTALATWLFFRSQRPAAIFGVGVLVGLAGLAKQPFLAVIVAPALTLTIPWPGLLASGRRLWPLFVGLACPLAAASLILIAQGSHDDYLKWAWLFNMQHVSAPVSASDAFLRFGKMAVPLLAASSALWVLALLAWRTFREGQDVEVSGGALSPKQRRFFLVTAFLVTLLPAFLGFRLFGHYFLPAHYFLVQLAAPAFLAAWSASCPKRWLAILAVAPGLVFSLLNPLLYAPKGGVAPVTNPVFEEVGMFLKQRHCQGPIFVWGYAPQVYYFAHRRPASRFIVPIEPVTGFVSGNEQFERGELPLDFHVSAASRAELLDDLRASRPSHIVDFSATTFDHWDRFPLSTFPEVLELVARGYHKLGTRIGKVTIYESRSCQEGGRLP
jgi:hypothetical protein